MWWHHGQKRCWYRWMTQGRRRLRFWRPTRSLRTWPSPPVTAPLRRSRPLSALRLSTQSDWDRSRCRREHVPALCGRESEAAELAVPSATITCTQQNLVMLSQYKRNSFCKIYGAVQQFCPIVRGYTNPVACSTHRMLSPWDKNAVFVNQTNVELLKTHLFNLSFSKCPSSDFCHFGRYNISFYLVTYLLSDIHHRHHRYKHTIISHNTTCTNNETLGSFCGPLNWLSTKSYTWGIVTSLKWR